MEYPYHYTRLLETDEGLFLIVGGEDRDVGKEDNDEKRYEALEEYCRSRFGVTAFSHRWSGQINAAEKSWDCPCHGSRFNTREFTHLSVQEKRTHARAANLDPEFIENGLHAASVWHQTQILVQRTGEELRQAQEEIRRWDEVVVELRAITDGIEAANLKRKHRLGSASLQIYRIVGIQLRGRRPEDAYMRPYYENMKRAYLRTQQFRKRKKKEEPPAE